MSSSFDLAFTLSHTVAFLTRSLIGRYSATTIDLLRFTLERNLTKQFENNWYPAEPQRGSGRRCLTLIPHHIPPRSIYYACKSARISWDEWMQSLGNFEMSLFIDPGCVSLRFPGINKTSIVWSAIAQLESSQPVTGGKQETSLAQSSIDEEEEEELFNLIRNEVCLPTPTVSHFSPISRPAVRVALPFNITKPASPEPESAVSTMSTSSLLSTHSRGSSRSSDTSSSRFSFSSIESAGTGMSSLASYGQHPSATIPMRTSKFRSKDPLLIPASTLLLQAPVSFDDDDELDDAAANAHRLARVHIDRSKTEATPYDGGKTTVLTGGVMLGMKAQGPPKTPSTPRFSATPQAAVRPTVWRKLPTAGTVARA